jgi:hypothetical protein
VPATLAIDDVDPPRGAPLALRRVEADARALMRKEKIVPGPSVPATLGGAPARRFDGVAKTGLRVRELVAIHAGTVYTLTLVAAPAVFGRRAATFEDVIRSWRWE